MQPTNVFARSEKSERTSGHLVGVSVRQKRKLRKASALIVAVNNVHVKVWAGKLDTTQSGNVTLDTGW